MNSTYSLSPVTITGLGPDGPDDGPHPDDGRAPSHRVEPHTQPHG